VDPNQSNLGIIKSWLHQDQGEATISKRWFDAVIAENPSLLDQLATSPAGTRIATREDFNEWARRNGYGSHDANWNVIQNLVHGQPFFAHQLEVSIKGGHVHLAKASESEKAEVAQQRETQHVEQENARRVQLPTHELKKLAAQELAEAHQQAENASIERQIEYREMLDQQHGFPELPRVAQDGRVLDSKFFQSLPAVDFRRWMKNYGAAQLTARINEPQGA
jgi:hypothetical protein